MSLNMHHLKAAWLLGATTLLVVFVGVLTGFAHHVSPWHGMYCTTGFATTAGCDLPMTTAEDYILGEISMLLMVPLFTSVFAFITAGITADHVDKRMSN